MNVRPTSLSPSILSVIAESPILEYATTHQQTGVYKSSVVKAVHVKQPAIPRKPVPSLSTDTTKAPSSTPPPPVPTRNPNRNSQPIPTLMVTTEILPPHRPPPPLPPYSPEAYNYYTTYNQTQKSAFPKPFNLERVKTSSSIVSIQETSSFTTSSHPSSISSMSSASISDSDISTPISSQSSSSSSSVNDSDDEHIVSLYGIGRKPTLIDCPQCNRRVLTRTKTRDNNISHLFRRHTWLQFMNHNKAEAVEHRCSACAAHIANWHEGKDVEVVAAVVEVEEEQERRYSNGVPMLRLSIPGSSMA